MPSVSSAYCVELEEPTSATGPGSRIAVGARRTSSLPGGWLPKKNPQWSACAAGIATRWGARVAATAAVPVTSVAARHSPADRASPSAGAGGDAPVASGWPGRGVEAC